MRDDSKGRWAGRTRTAVVGRASTGLAVLVVLLAACRGADPGDESSSGAVARAGAAQPAEGLATRASGAESTQRAAAGLDTGAAYVCPPCAPHDTLVFHEDGECPVCGMKLIERPDSSRVGHAHLQPGSGNFLLEGGPGHEEKLITVFYHVPENLEPESPVLVVVPGSGRDAYEYRDAWVEASEEHGVLVLSPMYTEDEYGFGDYHMGGVIDDLNLDEAVEYADDSNEVFLDEERFAYRVNTNSEAWIFADFDRIFEKVAAAVGSTRESYDAFGHSAGGQILHRMVLLRPDSDADRILAGNSGFYTMPDLDARLPFGLENAPVGRQDLRRSFAERLVLFLGDEDDRDGTGGIFLRSPSADAQGPGRLERGRHFYRRARELADEMGTEFEWDLEVVPGVGHDHEGMSRAAAEYLYGDGGGA